MSDGDNMPGHAQAADKNGVRSGGGDADNYKSYNKGNEDKKVFVGGISSDTTEQDLQSYFARFGEVTKAEVKVDRMTGRSRGFAFVEFGSADACKKSQQELHTINNRQVEVKPAKSRENKKVFIGGLPSEFPEDDLKKHFEQFGAVGVSLAHPDRISTKNWSWTEQNVLNITQIEDIEWPFDKQRGAKRNFAFVVFEEEEAANRASSENKQMFGDRQQPFQCDVKKATPQRRGGMMGGGPGGFGGRGGFRGGRGGGGYGGAGGGYGPYGGYGGNMYGSQAYSSWGGASYGGYGGGYGHDGGNYNSQYGGGNDYWGTGGGQQQSHQGAGGGYGGYGQSQGGYDSYSHRSGGQRGGYGGQY